MRRKRRRTSLDYRLYRFLRDRMPAPRRRRFRVADRRRFAIAQAALAVVAVVALGLSASVVIRSVRTARTNARLAALHTVEAGAAPTVEIAALPSEGSSSAPNGGMTLSFMGMPDGSAIPTSARAESAPAALHDTLSDVLPDMLKLLKTNGDTVGWLYIKGTVSLPVVYRDNEYYLTRDFYGKKNASGTLFLDESHPLTANAQNLLIHGHSMNDGSMFGLLTHYQKLDFLKSHPMISFSTLWEKEAYVVIAVLKVSSNPGDPNHFDYYSHPCFASGAAFDDYIRAAKARSMFDIPVNAQPTDALLTLSTCLDDDRLAVIARKLRSGETRDEMTAAMMDARLSDVWDLNVSV